MKHAAHILEADPFDEVEVKEYLREAVSIQRVHVPRAWSEECLAVLMS